MTPAITIRIGRLDFIGLDAGEAQRAARHFEMALQSLLERDGLPAGIAAADLESMDLGRLSLRAGTPEVMGRQLAQRLLERLTP